jgi:hypothetical protein
MSELMGEVVGKGMKTTARQQSVVKIEKTTRNRSRFTDNLTQGCEGKNEPQMNADERR